MPKARPLWLPSTPIIYTYTHKYIYIYVYTYI